MRYGEATFTKHIRKIITYTGAANLGATGTAATIFTVTGEVLVVALVPVCTTNLGESAASSTITLGVTGDVDLFILATAALDIDADDFWFDATPIEVGGIAIPAALKDIAITANIISDHTGVGNTNAGVIRYELYWSPLSLDAQVS